MTGVNRWLRRFLKDLGTVHGQAAPPEPPLLWFCCGEEYYVMASDAGSDWVRDVRAAGGRVVVTHEGEQYAAHLTELPVLEGAELIRVRAEQLRRHFGVEPDAGPDEIKAIAGRRPVFRVDAASR